MVGNYWKGLRKHLLLLTAVILVQACECGPDRRSETVASMKQALLTALPVGTPLDSARKMMIRSGFTVQEKVGGDFSEEGHVHQGLNYLYCDCTESPRFLMAQRWQVAIVHSAGSVTDILVSLGYTGL